MCIDEDNKFSELAIASNFLFLILELSSSILILRISILLLSNTNRVIKTSNTLFNPSWISISGNEAIIMSNVYTIIIYIVSMYSNIRG